MAVLLPEQIHMCTLVLRKDNITRNKLNWPLQLHHIQASQSLQQIYSADMVKWIGGVGGAWHIISLLGVCGNRISFLSQIKMMRHAGMNNFMAIDIHTLTNRKKSYGRIGNGFISGGKKEVLFQQFEKCHLVVCQSDCWCWIKIC